MRSHFLNLVLYAFATGALFSLFMREGRRERIRFALWLGAAMVGAAVAAGWLMYVVK